MWKRPSIAAERAAELRTAILNESPETIITRRARIKELQDAGSILVVVLSHIAIGGIIEGVRRVWEQSRLPVKIALPDGSVIVV